MSGVAGRRLSVDLGTVRIGLALSDPLGITAQPLAVLRRESLAKDLDRLADLVAGNDVVEIVLGLPLALSGEAGESAARAEAFAAKLRGRVEVPVVLWDERLTTAQAERLLVAADVSRRRRRQVVDSLAASILLESYLQASRSSST